MPRQSRIDAPGALHHVMIRGIERRKIFQDDKDRDSFLDRLGGILLESSTPCYAWSLLSNHAHFLLRTGKISISRVMRKLLTGYAVTFTRRYHRHARPKKRYRLGCGQWGQRAADHHPVSFHKRHDTDNRSARSIGDREGGRDVGGTDAVNKVTSRRFSGKLRIPGKSHMQRVFAVLS